MKLILNLTENQFDANPYWTKPLNDESFLLPQFNGLELFDQNGYHLTIIEQAYSIVNGYAPSSRREESVIRKTWFESNNPLVGPHLNHSELFQRKGFSEEAKDQLKMYAKKNPLLWKLIKMKPKWGIDLSVDYVNEDGEVFEIFHYEWDSFDLNEVNRMKTSVENFAIKCDWDNLAKILIKRKEEWIHLDFFEQSKWKTDLYELSPEKFKNIIWEA